MGQSIVQIDAFTNEAFRGNSAAICLLEAPADESWMRNVAREMNLSETAYLLPNESGYGLRWFTPDVEVKLCGHATVAAAHFLWEEGHLDEDETALFDTLSGELTARKNGSWIEVSFPSQPPHEMDPPHGLEEDLGARPLYFGQNELGYGLVVIEDEEHLRNLSPDFLFMSTLPHSGYIVTATSDSTSYDFVSRFFAPKLGVNEDPVTGSAHCMSGPYWSGVLGKTELLAHQASARGGDVRVRVEGARTILGGQAVTVMRGELV